MNKQQKEILQASLNSEKEVLKKLTENYQDAIEEIDNRIAILQGRQDADLQHVIYQLDYQKALKTQIQTILDQLQNNNFESISEYLTQSYEDGFLGTMYDMQAQGIPLVFPIDQEQVVAAIQHETQLSESLYSALGKDTKVLSKQIAGEISRGIANAAMYSEMSRNIASYCGISKNKAMRIARTEAHRIQNKAISNAQWKAKEKGADIVKIWSAALDGKTRNHHRKLDGQIRELDEPFEVEGMEAMEPGGFGVASEDINCRCRCNSKARWLLDKPFTKWSEDAPVLIDDDGTTQLLQFDNMKDYEDFKQKYWKAIDDGSVRSSVQKMTKGTIKGSGQVGDALNGTVIDSVREFDYNDAENMKKEIESFMETHKNSDVEHNIIFTRSGKVYELTGTNATVDARVIGEEELVGSIGSHNHPPFEGFDRGDAHSVDDVIFAIEHRTGEEYVPTGSKKFCFKYTGEMNAEEMAKAYEEAMNEVLDESFRKGEIVDFRQEETMKRLAQTIEGFEFYEL